MKKTYRSPIFDYTEYSQTEALAATASIATDGADVLDGIYNENERNDW